MNEIIQIHSQKRQEWIDITRTVQKAIDGCHALKGAALLFVPHTTAAITINENADPDVREDINRFLDALVPKNGYYRHLEGNADAHIKSTLIGVSLTIPIEMENYYWAHGKVFTFASLMVQDRGRFICRYCRIQHRHFGRCLKY